MKKPRSRADEFAEYEHRPVQDFDPEGDNLHDLPAEDDSSGSEDGSDNGFTGREHYTAVGKSKLRGQDPALLGPQYEGSRISRRGAQERGSENDPFAGFDEEEGSQSDEDEASLGSISASTENEEEEDGTEVSSIDDESSSDELKAPNGAASKRGEDREELRRLMNDDSKAVTASIAQANKDDAEKGVAVRQQRNAFDSLLNSRIRLQPGLVSLNSIASISQEEKKRAAQEKIRAAETAALNLWNTIESLRCSLQDVKAGEKRKRLDATDETKSRVIWNHMQTHESLATATHRSNLSKWSLKTQPANTHTAKSKLNPSARPSTILDSVDGQLANPDRLVKRTRLPRSCAPLQASLNIAESADIYDDADFYGVLLKELLEQRNAAAASNIQFDRIAEQWQAARDAKTKKQVDTKASKGRKLRYTVHEKLQNFMAPENRCTWEDRQIDELFGSLLGKRFALDESATHEDQGESNQDGSEEQALRLFRS